MMTRYRWDTDELWDDARGCRVIWKTATGDLAIANEYREKIEQALNLFCMDQRSKTQIAIDAFTGTGPI